MPACCLTLWTSRADTLLPSLTPCKVSLFFFSRCGPPLFCAPTRFQTRPHPRCPQRALNAPSQGTPIQPGLTAKTYTTYSPPSPLSLAVCSCVVLERDMTGLVIGRPFPLVPITRLVLRLVWDHRSSLATFRASSLDAPPWGEGEGTHALALRSR